MKEKQLQKADFKIISEKKGVAEIVYKPKNYPGPIAINVTVKK